jgi:hypothetical protein
MEKVWEQNFRTNNYQELRYSLVSTLAIIRYTKIHVKFRYLLGSCRQYHYVADCSQLLQEIYSTALNSVKYKPSKPSRLRLAACGIRPYQMSSVPPHRILIHVSYIPIKVLNAFEIDRKKAGTMTTTPSPKYRLLQIHNFHRSGTASMRSACTESLSRTVPSATTNWCLIATANRR